MKFLSQEQIDLLSASEAQAELDLLGKTYPLDTSLAECYQEVWPQMDEIVNQLIGLENHMRYLEQVRFAQLANHARWHKDTPELESGEKQ